MPKRGIGRAAAAALGAVCALSLAACGGSGSAKRAGGAGGVAASASGTPSGASSVMSSSPSPSAAAATATPTAPGSMDPSSSARLSPALLTPADLPAGFHTRPLTLRNLPSLVHGCPGLEALQQTGIGDQAQGEWTRGALDAYLDEAVIEPRGDTAAGLVAKTAAALDACGSVKVVEEGLSVTLTVTPLALPSVGDTSHAWHTTGKLVLPMQMNGVLVQQGALVVLLAQTHVGGPTDEALTLQAARAAAQKAADFQRRR